MRAERWVDEVLDLASLALPVDRADSLQLAHDPGDRPRVGLDHLGQFLARGADLVAVVGERREQRCPEAYRLQWPAAALRQIAHYLVVQLCLDHDEHPPG